MYEILDQFKAATTRQAKIHVLRKNNTTTLRDYLFLTFNPNIRFFTTFFPTNYKPDRDAPPGMGFSHLGVEMRRMYLFILNHPASKNLSFSQRDHLLVQMLESLEPREAEMVMAMFRKNLPSLELTSDVVNEAFPGLLA